MSIVRVGEKEGQCGVKVPSGLLPVSDFGLPSMLTSGSKCSSLFFYDERIEKSMKHPKRVIIPKKFPLRR